MNNRIVARILPYLVAGALGCYKPETASAPTEAAGSQRASPVRDEDPSQVAVSGSSFPLLEVPKPTVDTNPDPLALTELLWGTFVAINWPADTNAGRGVRADRPYTEMVGPRVWETWKQEWEIEEPTDWNSYAVEKPRCDYVEEEPGNLTPVTAKNWPVFYRKFSTVLNMINTTSIDNDRKDIPTKVAGPLIDKNGEYVRYEIRYNRELYDCVRSGAGEGCSNKPMQLTLPAANIERIGAITLKAAWRKMLPSDKDSTYYTRRILVQDFKRLPPENKPKSVCRPETMGLIGMHVVYKHEYLKTPGKTDRGSDNAPNAWAWFTVEHKDNPPLCPENPENNATGRPSSFGLPWDRSFSYSPEPRTPGDKPPAKPQPVWLCRKTASDDVTDGENRKFRKLLSAYPPWGNYEFVTGQWLSSGSPNIDKMANSTIEPYAQRESCMGCHTGNAQKTDFVWSLCMQRDDCFRGTGQPELISPAPPGVGAPPDGRSGDHATRDPWHYGKK
ncbi:hypothetical protein [Sorangium sp. So ce1182]|uniref:hypothetical protein n=1 Tax=Sorangium sp. So ce1182 TaxID=3133334 RepID=UPI003F5EF865